MRIIGCGNADRGDDAAGLVAARRLRELGIDARELSGDMLALIDEWSDADEVILVDAVVTGAAPGATTTWDAGAVPLPSVSFPCSTHALGVAEVIELARAMQQLPAKVTVHGIEGQSFQPGRTPSPAVVHAAKQLAQKVAEACNYTPALRCLPKPSGSHGCVMNRCNSRASQSGQ